MNDHKAGSMASKLFQLNSYLLNELRDYEKISCKS